MGAFCRSKCKIARSVARAPTRPAQPRAQQPAHWGHRRGHRTPTALHSGRTVRIRLPISKSEPMRNLVVVTVASLFASAFSRVRFPRSRSARAPCTGYNHPFTGLLCLKGKIVTKFQAQARARLERQRGGRTANQDRRSMCRSFHGSAWRQDARFAVRSTAQRARNLTRHSSV